MKETVKKLVCIIVVITIVLAVPSVSSASSPSSDDYRVVLDYEGLIYYDAWDYWWTLKASDPALRLGEIASVTLFPNDTLRIRLEYNFTSQLKNYFPFMATASNVWMSLKTEFEQTSSADVQYGINAFYSHYDAGDGVVEDKWYETDTSGTSKTTYNLPPYDFGSELSGVKSYDSFSVVQRIDLQTSAVDFTHTIKVNSFALILYLQGISGTDVDMTIVINSGLKDVESAVNQVESEIKVLQGQMNGVQNDINTGFDNVTGAINGAGSDTSGMDSGMAQLGGQLGDLGNVEDELGGLIMDKVEVPDLILTNDQGSALALLVSCLNLAYVDLKDYQVMFASVMFFGIIGVLLFGRRNL